MDKDFNLVCDDLKIKLTNLINESELPVAATYYILKDIFHNVENFYIGYLNEKKIKQAAEQQKKDKEDEEED